MVSIEKLQKFFKHRTVYLLLGILLVGIIVGIGLDHLFIDPLKEFTYNGGEFHTGGYKLINPTLECRNSEIQGTVKYKLLQAKIRDYINNSITDNKLISASVYFRDLNNGPWFGIADGEDFAPSSLLKLPVLIAYLKQAEANPGLLDKKIIYDKDPEGLIPQTILPKLQLEKGKQYSVNELIDRMIIYSDNVSLRLLENNIDNNLIDRVTLDLDIPTVTDKTPTNFMSVKDYSTLFRVLFNASYLTKAMSEKALDLLTKADFKGGLVAGVPNNILVSHKFGERDLPGDSNQLHDCGIVYYLDNPYLLCIMTRGNDQKSLEKVIQDISKQVYDDTTTRYK